MGDHATNIAETVYYMIEGEPIAERAAEGRHHELRADADAMTKRNGSEHERTNPQHPDRRGRRAADAAAALQSRSRRLRGRDRRARRRRRYRGCKESPPDLVVLDWMLPGLSGIELCRRLRARPETQALPIIMLTARGEESERVRGLATGADDYIVKPFSVPELIARVARAAAPRQARAGRRRARARRHRARPRARSACSRAGRDVDLGPTEFRLLEFLMERPGRVFSREQLLDGVWGSRSLYRRAHRRRPCRAAAQGAQSRPRRRPDPHRARLRLLARRPLRQGELAISRAQPGRRVRPSPPRRRRLIGDARVIGAIGQAGHRLAAAEEELRRGRDRRSASGRSPR